MNGLRVRSARSVDRTTALVHTIAGLLPVAVGRDQGLQARVARVEAIRAKTREVERISARLKRERQFNKRVAINAELRAAAEELANLKGESTTSVVADGVGAGGSLGRPV